MGATEWGAARALRRILQISEMQAFVYFPSTLDISVMKDPHCDRPQIQNTGW